VLAVLVLFVAGRCLVPMDETDLFFNLRLGEIVLHTGHVPTTNLLSFTHPNAPDVNLAWLFQVVLALAHRWGGIPGTVVLKSAFVVGTWAVLYRVARRRGAHPAAAALALALAAWSAEPRFVERPHLVTFLGLALLLLAIERSEAGRPRMLWLFVPGALVWANANSCFFLAPSILLLYAAGARLEGRAADARRALLVGLALVPFIFATPSGTGCLPYLANHFRMPSVRPLQEYRVAQWPVDGPFLLLLVALAAGAAWRRVPLRWALPVAALALLGSRRIRFVAEFSILAGPALAVSLTALLPRARAVTAGAGALLVALALAPRVRGPALDLGMEGGLVPEAAIAFAEGHGLRERMYNDLEVGSYLALQGWPRYRVFQDPRINGYPAAFHAVLRRADLGREEWQRFLDGFGVDAALVTYPDVNPRGALFAPELWALVYRDSEALVFTRRLPERQALITARELPVTFDYAPEAGLTARPLTRSPGPVPACEWQRRLGDFQAGRDERAARAAYEAALASPGCLAATEEGGARRALGALALRQGDPARALALLDGFEEAEAATNRAFALLALSRPAEALAGFEAVLRLAPANDEATFGRALALEALGRPAEAIAAYEAFLAHAPGHLAAARARERLRRLRAR
jgi:tetratricopeptide (TPR) repeat protein